MGTTLSKIKAGAKKHAGAALGTTKNVVTCVAVGGGSYYGAKELFPRVEFLQKNWYGIPAVMIGLGYYLRNKKPLIAGALLGAAGYVGANAYDIKTQNEKKNAPPATRGLDAAAIVDRVFDDQRGIDSDAGAFVDISPAELREMLRAA